MSSENRFLALLRGINVGGNNIISKEELKQCFEDLGHTNVRTYIQSGNILFRSDEHSIEKLTKAIEAELTKRFNYSAHAVVLSRKMYGNALASAPKGWGEDESQKHNALFMLTGRTPEDWLADLPDTNQFELITAGKHVVFWSISIEHQTKTTYMELAKNKLYKEVTIRNSNTSKKLLALFEEI